MELKMKIITVTKCSPEGKDPYTRIDYIALDQDIKYEKIKGKPVKAMFISGLGAFEKIPTSVIDTEVYVTLEYEENPYNPMRPRCKCKSLRTKTGVIEF